MSYRWMSEKKAPIQAKEDTGKFQSAPRLDYKLLGHPVDFPHLGAVGWKPEVWTFPLNFALGVYPSRPISKGFREISVFQTSKASDFYSY